MCGNQEKIELKMMPGYGGVYIEQNCGGAHSDRNVFKEGWDGK